MTCIPKPWESCANHPSFGIFPKTTKCIAYAEAFVRHRSCRTGTIAWIDEPAHNKRASKKMTSHFSPASAIWNNRGRLAEVIGELRDVRNVLQQAMGGPRDFLPQQWLQVASIVYDFKPDLIIELGRAYGNSTCAMALAAKMLRPQSCRIVSLCLSDVFNRVSRPHLESHLRDLSMLAAVEPLECNILAYDFEPTIASAQRVFIFWDAHGYDVAHAILAGLMRKLQGRPHLALVHDMADLKYFSDDFRRYEIDAEWLAYGSAAPKYILGDVGAQYDEGIALVDFLGRNRIGFHSAESSYFPDLSDEQARELDALFGTDFSRYGFWYYFSLNEAGDRTLTFPPKPQAPQTTPVLQRRGSRLATLIAECFR